MAVREGLITAFGLYPCGAVLADSLSRCARLDLGSLGFSSLQKNGEGGIGCLLQPFPECALRANGGEGGIRTLGVVLLKT